jgi:hypothetical protein
MRHSSQCGHNMTHILPHARGGKTHPDNMVTACAPCNFGPYFYVLEEVGLFDPRERKPIKSSWDGLERLLQPCKNHAVPAGAEVEPRNALQRDSIALRRRSGWVRQTLVIATRKVSKSHDREVAQGEIDSPKPRSADFCAIGNESGFAKHKYSRYMQPRKTITYRKPVQ